MEEYERYVVKAASSKNPNEGYYTDDLDDAVGTAKAQAASMGVPFKVVDNRKKRLAATVQPDGSIEHSKTSVLTGASKQPGMVSIDKTQLREMIRAAVIKRLEEGKGKPTDKSKKHDKDDKKRLKHHSSKRDFKKEIDDAKKRLKEAQEKFTTLQEQAGHTTNGSRLGKQSVGKEAMGGGVPGAMPPMEEGPFSSKKPAKKVNPYSSEELLMFIHNSHNFMEGHVKKAIERFLARQMKAGQYNSAQAPTLWMHLVDAAAKAYIEDYGSGTELIDQVFTKQDRMQAAIELAKDFEKAIENGDHTVDDAIGNFHE